MPLAWTPADIPALTGRRILITGANSGIGYAAALELARHGATVLLACRDRTRGEAALARLRRETGTGAAELILLDLASQASIHQVAQSLLAQAKPIDVLVNNAGVMAPSSRRETADGFELQFGTNVLGHFALTGLLLPLLAPRGRIITVASIAHKRGRIHFDDLQSLRSYSPMGAYQQSKLADLMFALELDRRLRAAALPIRSIAVHPGIARSNLFKVGSSRGLAATAERLLQSTLGILFNSDAGGAVPTLFAATAPDAQGGHYYGSQQLFETRGHDVGSAFISPAAQDAAAQHQLWQICEQLTGITYP